MKRILAACALLALSLTAAAQFAPNTVLTAAALNAALAAPNITSGSINGSTPITTTGAVTLNGTNNLGAATSATTQGYLDNSTLVATTQFTKRSLLAATATIPWTVSSGTYNFASVGSGAIVGVTTSGGAVTTITSIVAGGVGYQVGDCLVLTGGNGDGLIYVSAVSSGAVTAASVLYGGTGYTGTPQLTVASLSPGSRSGNLTGTLTGNVTIVIPSGTYLAGARRIGFANNTTGPYTVTVKLSDGAGGSTGTGVVLPQGTNNSTSMTLYTNGVSDVWPEVGAATNLTVSGSMTVGGRNLAFAALTGTTGSLGGSPIGSGSCASTTVTIAGANVGNIALTTPNTYPGNGFYWQAYVSAANTVTVNVCSTLSGSNTPTASTYAVRVPQ
jgi:hypothetical protein